MILQPQFQTRKYELYYLNEMMPIRYSTPFGACNPRDASYVIAQEACSILSLLNSLGSIQPLDTELTAGALHSTIAITATAYR